MLRHRLVTAICLGALFLAALFLLPDLPWALFLLAFILIGAREWCGLAGFGRRGQVAFMLVMLGWGLLLLPGTGWLPGLRNPLILLLLGLSAVFWLSIAPFWLLQRLRVTRSLVLGPVGLIVLLSAWVALVELRHLGPLAVLGVMATVWLADSAAYFAGRRFGKHKLAPEISPGKTWEGFCGAVLSVMLCGVLACLAWSLSFWFLPGLLLLVVLSVIGDLFESWIKRVAGKKDSGTLLPGHGGVLDRIDALLPTLPLTLFALYLPVYLGLLRI